MTPEEYERLMSDEKDGCYPEDCDDKISEDTFTYYSHLLGEESDDTSTGEEDN